MTGCSAVSGSRSISFTCIASGKHLSCGMGRQNQKISGARAWSGSLGAERGGTDIGVLVCVCVCVGAGCNQGSDPECPFGWSGSMRIRKEPRWGHQASSGTSWHLAPSPPPPCTPQACTHQHHLSLWHGYHGLSGCQVRDARSNPQSPLLASGHLACGAALRGSQ